MSHLYAHKYKNVSLFQYTLKDLSGSVSLAWVGDGTGVSVSLFSIY